MSKKKPGSKAQIKLDKKYRAQQNAKARANRERKSNDQEG